MWTFRIAEMLPHLQERNHNHHWFLLNNIIRTFTTKVCKFTLIQPWRTITRMGDIVNDRLYTLNRST